MIPILKKELNSFFSSPIGYMVIAIYLIINGLFLWVFNGEFNLLHAGFADLSAYFFLAPQVFLFLIPAITMKSFSEEINSGTIEILKTKPLSAGQIVLGKYFGALLLAVIAILPTFIYVYSIYQLGNPIGNLNIGTIIGSFIGLLFLASAYTAIGIFSSTISKNQIVSFMISVSICFFLYFGFEAFWEFDVFGNTDFPIQNLGMIEHFNSISKGVLDTRDLIYFITITIGFLYLTRMRIQNDKNLFKIVPLLLIVAIINFLGSITYKRFDLTEDHRFTLSDTTKEIVNGLDKIVTIKVYLKGNFPAEFKRLQTETKQHLEELKALNRFVRFRFVDPTEIGQDLINVGLEPSRLQIQEQGQTSELIIFPWAVVQHKNKLEKVSLLKDIVSYSQDEQLESSIQNLEYAFSHAIHKLTAKKTKKIAVLKGNGELDDIYLADFLRNLGEYYHLAPFSLDPVESKPQITFEGIRKFDLAIIAKPTEKFSEKEKFNLDQFIMNGGKTLWAIDQVQAELDSLTQTGESLAYPRDLALTDLLFNYGVRINTNLISDQYCSQIPLATGNIGNQTRFTPFSWPYFPLLNSANNHAINNNIEAVHIKFGSTIDTLKNNIRKTVLLQSSTFSKPLGTPAIISLKSVADKPNPEEYNAGNQPVAVLLEGEFKSAYMGRIKPFKIDKTLENGVQNKMVVISDGDIIANDVSNGKPQILGVDKWSKQTYGNKDFLLNTVNYLLDDIGLINIRSKTVKMAFLNKQKAYEQAGKWQLVNIILPLLILTLFGIGFHLVKKKKYQ